jgi:hypothetical protein
MSKSPLPIRGVMVSPTKNAEYPDCIRRIQKQRRMYPDLPWAAQKIFSAFSSPLMKWSTSSPLHVPKKIKISIGNRPLSHFQKITEARAFSSLRPLVTQQSHPLPGWFINLKYRDESSMQGASILVPRSMACVAK